MVQDLSAPWQGLRPILLGRNERTVALIQDLMDWAIQYLGKLSEGYVLIAVKIRPVLDRFLTMI